MVEVTDAEGGDTETETTDTDTQAQAQAAAGDFGGAPGRLGPEDISGFERQTETQDPTDAVQPQQGEFGGAPGPLAPDEVSEPAPSPDPTTDTTQPQPGEPGGAPGPLGPETAEELSGTPDTTAQPDIGEPAEPTTEAAPTGFRRDVERRVAEETPGPEFRRAETAEPLSSQGERVRVYEAGWSGLQREQATESLDRQLPIDVTEADVQARRQGGEIRATLTPAAQARLFEAQTGRDVGPADLQRTATGRLALTEQAIAEDIAAETPGVEPDEVLLARTGGETEVRIVDDYLADNPRLRQAYEDAARLDRPDFADPARAARPPAERQRQQAAGRLRSILGVSSLRRDEGDIRIEETNPRQQARGGGELVTAALFGASALLPGDQRGFVSDVEQTIEEDTQALPERGFRAELTPQGREEFFTTVASMDPETRPINPETGERYLGDVRQVEQTDRVLEFDEEGNLENIKQRPSAIDFLTGPPGPGVIGDIDRAVTGAGSIGAQTAVDIGATVTDPVVGAVEDSPIGDVAGEIEGYSQLALGPAGLVERGIGDFVGTTAEGYAKIGAAYDELVFQPAAELAGDVERAFTATNPITIARTGELPSEEDLEIDVEPEADPTAQESAATKVLGGAGSAVRMTTFDAPQTAIQAGEAAGAGAEFTAEAITETESPARGLATGAAAAGTAGVALGTQVAEQTVRRPFTTAGTLAGSLPAGIVAGRALGAVGRRVAPRIRTAGGPEIPYEAIASREVRMFYDPDQPSPPEGRFPGAADKDLYERAPAEALQRQAPQFTPDPIEALYREAGVTEGTALQKAMGAEPEGPRRGRAAQGFEAVPEERGLDPSDVRAGGEFEYETPGAFAGPEASPNFYRIDPESTPSARQSLRPGLPDIFTGQPTQLFVRSEIEEPDATDLPGYRAEMARREGETTIRTKPPGVGSASEAEAGIPPGATFVDVGSVTGGRLRNALRRIGIGADFYTVSPQGVRVPIRVTAREADIDASESRGIRDLLRSERGQLGPDDVATTTSFRRIDIDERASRARQTPANRPLVSPVGIGDGTSERSTVSETVDRIAPSDAVSEPVLPSEPISEPVSEPISEPTSETVSGPSGISIPSQSIPSQPYQPPTTSSPYQPPTTSTPSIPSTSVPTTTTSIITPGIGASGGSVGPPIPPTEPTIPRPEFPDDEPDRREFPVFGGARKGFYTDFLDPIGAQRLETTQVDFPERPDQPVLIDYIVEARP